jgi:hypothetical protein
VNALRRLAGYFWPGDDPQPDANGLVLLATPSGQIEAESWRELLASHDIPSLVRDAGPLAYQGGWMLQRWQVHVRAGDAERAREVLALEEE